MAETLACCMKMCLAPLGASPDGLHLGRAMVLLRTENCTWLFAACPHAQAGFPQFWQVKTQCIRKVPGLTLPAGSLGAFALHGTAGVTSQHAGVSAQVPVCLDPRCGQCCTNSRPAVCSRLCTGDAALCSRVPTCLVHSRASPRAHLPPRNKCRCYAPHALPGALHPQGVCPAEGLGMAACLERN